MQVIASHATGSPKDTNLKHLGLEDAFLVPRRQRKRALGLGKLVLEFAKYVINHSRAIKWWGWYVKIAKTHETVTNSNSCIRLKYIDLKNAAQLKNKP